MELITAFEYNVIQEKIANVLGIGSEDYGYGQPVLSEQIEVGTVLTADIFNALRTDILNARQHQVGRYSSPPIAVVPVTGQITKSAFTQYTSATTLAVSNRLIVPPSSQATRGIPSAAVLTDEWNNTTIHTVEYDFGTADAMRFYFNTGSTIEFNATLTNSTSSTKNRSWVTLLASVGVVSFKRNSTTSSKSVGTTIGYSKLTTDDQVVFQKVTTDLFKPNTYSILAKLSDSGSGIIFTIRFTDSSTSGIDVNVNGTLTSSVNTYRATGDFVEVALPDLITNEIIGGDANPTYVITRSVNQITESDPTGVDFIIHTTNVDAGTVLYWTITGYGITPDDFINLDSITNIPITITDSGSSDPLNIVAAPDLTTEKLEKFNLQIRATPNTLDPLLTDISGLLEQISDTSISLPIIASAPTYKFVSQTITSVDEGKVATFTIVATGLTKQVAVHWKTVGLIGNVTKEDFADLKLEGDFNILSSYTLTRSLVSNDGADGLNGLASSEVFQIELWVTENGVPTLKDTSATMTVRDSFVAVDEGRYTVSTNRVTSIAEGSSSGVTFTLTTPSVPNNTKIWWKAFLSSSTGNLIDGDFSTTGGTGIGGTPNSYIVVQAKSAYLTRYAKFDNFTEGVESFYVQFYSDDTFEDSKWLATSDSINITETVPYTISRSATSMLEGGTLGAGAITYTVTTPMLEPAGTLSKVFYWTIPQVGVITSDDFYEGLFGEFKVDYNPLTQACVGTFTVTAKPDGSIEGPEQFHVEIRATPGTSGELLISSLNETVNEPDVYNLDYDTTMQEGGARIAFNVTTPKMASGTVYWSLNSSTAGAVVAADFAENRVSGPIPITNNSGTFYLTALDDALTEGIESFTISIRTGSVGGQIKLTSDLIQINETVQYTVVGSTSLITEGQAGMTFRIRTPKISNGVPIYWRIIPVSGTFDTTDFTVQDDQSGSSNRTSGYVNMLNNTGVFHLTANSDNNTEGSETFKVQIYTKDAVTQEEIHRNYSDIVTISEIIPFSIWFPNNSQSPSVNEGESITLTVKTPKRDDNKPLFWKAVRVSGNVVFNSTSTAESDFDGGWQGSTWINKNQADIIVSINADNFTDNVDVIKIEVREVENSVQPVVTSLPIVINDISHTPDVPVVDPPRVESITTENDVLSVYEGQSIKFIVATSHVLPTTDIWWTLLGGSGFAYTDLSATNLYGGPLHVDDLGFLEIPFTVTSDQLNEGDETFVLQIHFTSRFTKVENTSAPITIKNSVDYGVSFSANQVKEGDSIKFYLSGPVASFSAPIRWTIAAANGSTITASDFSTKSGNIYTPLSSLYNTVTMSEAGTATVELYASPDSITEGSETFTVALSSTDGLTPKGLPSSPVTIYEDIGFTISGPTSIEEGSTEEWTVHTPKMSNVTLDVKIIQKEGNIRPSDFITGATVWTSLMTTVSISSNVGTIRLTANSSDSTEGDRTDAFSFELYYQGNQIFVDNPPVVYIGESSIGYQVTVRDHNTAVTKGSTMYFDVTTPKVDPNTKLYFEIVNTQSSSLAAVDFIETTATNSLSNNYVIIDDYASTATIQLTSDGNSTAKGDQTFYIKLRTGSSTGTNNIVASTLSTPITISEPKTYSIKASPTAISEGDTVTFTINTPYMNTGAVLYWKIISVSGPALSNTVFTGLPSSLQSSSTMLSGHTSITLSIPTANNNSAQAVRQFKLELSNTLSPWTPITIPADSVDIVTITDPGIYKLTANKESIAKGETVKYSFIIPASSTLTAFYWSITGDGISNNDFDKNADTVTIPAHLNTSATVTFNVTAAADGDNLPFTVVLKENSNSGNVITIADNPIVKLSQVFSISGESDITIGGAGCTLSVKVPTTVTKITWKVNGSGVIDGMITPGLSGDTDVVDGVATLPTLTAASGDGKSFVVEIYKYDNQANAPETILQAHSGNISIKAAATSTAKTISISPAVGATPSVYNESADIPFKLTLANYKIGDTLTYNVYYNAAATFVPALKTDFVTELAAPTVTNSASVIGSGTITLTNASSYDLTLTLADDLNRPALTSSQIKVLVSDPNNTTVTATSGWVTITPTSTNVDTSPIVQAISASIKIDSVPTRVQQGESIIILFTVSTTPLDAVKVFTIPWSVNDATINKSLIQSADGKTTVTTDSFGKGSLEIKIGGTPEIDGDKTFSIIFGSGTDFNTPFKGATVSTGSITVFKKVVNVGSFSSAGGATGTISTSTWTIPKDVTLGSTVTALSFVAMGGGGAGGGGGTQSPGSTGANGDKIYGTIIVPPGVTSLTISFPSGSAGNNVLSVGKTSATVAQTFCGKGGTGGAGVIISFTGYTTPICYVGGGGGGAGGGGNTAYLPTIPATPVRDTKLPKISAVLAGKTPAVNAWGNGGGGGCNGTAANAVSSQVSQKKGGAAGVSGHSFIDLPYQGDIFCVPGGGGKGGAGGLATYTAAPQTTTGAGGEVASVVITPVQTTTDSKPPTIGDAWNGGYYAGVVADAGGQEWYLIVAPKQVPTNTMLKVALGTKDPVAKWANSNIGTPTSTSLIEGFAISNEMNLALPSSPTYVTQLDPKLVTYPAYYVVKTAWNDKKVGGFSDWYLPSEAEMKVIYRAFKPNTTANAVNEGTNSFARPAIMATYGQGKVATSPSETISPTFRTKATGVINYFEEVDYWTSTGDTSTSSAYAKAISFKDGGTDLVKKSTACAVRPIRRMKKT